MAFRYRYETVLTYRRHLKEKSVIVFSRSLRLLAAARASLAATTESRAQAERLFQSELSGKIPAHRIKSHADYLRGLNERMAIQSREVEKCEKAVREKREDLLKKTKDCKVLEKLRERDLEKWEQEQNRLEQKVLDEISILRYARENS